MSRTSAPPGFVFRSAAESARRAKAKNAARLAAATAGRAALVSTARSYVPRGIVYGRSSLMSQEVKFFDTVIALPSVAGPWGLLPIASIGGNEPAVAFSGLTELNAVPQGATSFNRIGTKIVIKNITFSCLFQLLGTIPASANVRYLIVYDAQPNGAFPAYTDILSNNVTSGATHYSGVNMSNRARFTILRDRQFTLDENGGNGSQYTAKEFIRTKLECQYRTNTATIGDITTGALYFMAFATPTGTAVSYVSIGSPLCRIRFYD